ncbi:ligand-binding sensor domain-containing protein [Vulcaniibacterium tengchongense]|uniref:histidine kinase n=1 Tax=Vulcaniibacterium tengchongense TaxID=1273429 RepID=A0A3N4VHJ4_9GAMM|nr:ATP-binding protein [Vulcaniibacterium tengchongense]RPE80985.1 ligand-binding sensor domain-containing protein [Vulcaniibacterium tengchongense]
MRASGRKRGAARAWARRIGAGLALLAASVAPAVAGLPETPRPRQLTVADGLPSNRINGIAEDRSGYLWIATSDGLARYDGLGFRVWRAENGLRDSFVWYVHVDARNRVWVGTNDAGLAVLDPERKRFRFYDRRNTPAMDSDTVWTIASTSDGALWYGTDAGGLYRLDPDGRVARFAPRQGDPRSLPGGGVVQLETAADGSLWVGTKNGVARWTGRDFERLPDAALPSPIINGITAEDDGTLWFGTPRGVGVRRPNGSVSAAPWAELGIADPILHVLLRDRSGLYWFDVPQGLGYDNGGALGVVPLYSESAQGLVRPSWVGAYQDHEGGLWFASYTNGLWYLPANWRQFAVLSRRIGDPASLGNAKLSGIAPAADGGMWLVGSGGVLDRLDPETGAVRHVARDLGDGLVLKSVMEDAAGAVWVSFPGGLARVEPHSGRFRRWLHDDPDDPALAGTETWLAQSGDGTVWLVDDQSIVQAREPDGRVRATLRPGEDGGLARDAVVREIGRGPDGALWVATSRGLSMWNAGARRFEPVPGADARDVYGFAIAGERVWLARFGALEAYRWDGAALQPEGLGLDTRHGMPLIAPNGLTVDAAGTVWMSSVRGLIRADPAAGTVRVYGVHDGLPSQEFETPPVARPGDGRILVGSPEGLVMFDPSLVRPTTQAPPLIVESIDVRRGERRAAFPAERPFRVGPGDRDLRIVARLLSFNDARNHVYRFRLSGYDTGWVETGASGERVFSRLEPGEYLLRIAARTADNVWSAERSVRFVVAPPWWRTWPAIVGLAGLVALALWWLADAYRRRLKRRHAWQMAQHERELAKQASLAKTRFLATLGHEVRTPMTGVLGMSELLLDTPLQPQQRSYVESIRRAGQHLLRLVNDALDLARIESGKLDLAEQPFDLRALVDEAAGLMAPLARRRGLDFVIEIAPDAPRGLLGDGSRVCQILLNLLGNAIKFTEAGSVSLRVSALAPEGVRLEIADTGPGLNEEQKARLFRRFEQAEGARTAARYGGSGLGLAICQELAAAMGGRIRVESAPGEGARFIVELPLAAAPVPQAPAETRWPARRRALSLLLVEDDPTVAEVVAGLLRAQGHRVTHAPHGLAALAEAANARFDAALLDLDLPGFDGLELARQLQAQGFAAPLLAITARADAEAEPQAMAAGFRGFVRKPVTSAMLAGFLEATVGVEADAE